MPMSAIALKASLKAAYAQKLGDNIPGYSVIAADFDEFLDAIAEATAEEVVAHIQAFAQISGVQVTVASVAGVTPGAGVSGPGAGTGTAPPGSIT